MQNKTVSAAGPVRLAAGSTDALARRVDAYMRLHYRVSLDDLEQTDTPGYWQDKEQVEANARLIAAAPDLLGALLELADWYKEYTGLPPTAANAAIAKATGGQP